MRKKEKGKNNLFLIFTLIGNFFISILIFIPGTDCSYIFSFYILFLISFLYLLSLIGGIIQLGFMFLISFVLFIQKPEIIKYFFFEWIFILLGFFCITFRVNQWEIVVQKRRKKLETIKEKYNILSCKLTDKKNYSNGLDNRIKKYQILNEFIPLGVNFNFPTIIDFTISKIQEVFGYQYRYLIKLKENDIMRVKTNYDYSEIKEDKITEVFGIDKWILENCMPILVEDVKKEFRFKREESSLKSFMAVPIMKEKRPIGVIRVESFTKTYAFSQEDLRLLVVISDLISITFQNNQLYEQIQLLTITDILTQTYTYQYFHERLEYEIKRAKITQSVFSLLMIDIDHFKNCNDKYGYIVADKILSELAKTIKSTIRQVDLLARYSGEEFAIFLPETNRIGALKLADRIKKTIEEENFKINKTFMKITVSIGISSYPKDGEEKNILIEKTNQALCNAKEKGGNKIVSF